jgi:hypothetical protein
MTIEQVKAVEDVTPDLAELKELKKAGKFWEIFSKVKPIIELLIATGWFLPQKIKDALKALLLAGELFEQAPVKETPVKKVTPVAPKVKPVKKETAKQKEAREKKEAKAADKEKELSEKAAAISTATE